MAAAVLVLWVAAALPQEPPAGPPPTPAELLAKFAALPAAQQASAIGALERSVALAADDAVQRVAGRQRGAKAYAEAPAPRWFEPRDHAPAAAARALVPAGDPAHRAATAGMAPCLVLADLPAEVVYDWALGQPVRRAPRTPAERFAALVHGYPPGADQAVAQVLQALDTDPRQRDLASYFEHLYADRDGRVFAGVTLLMAWQTGRVIEMPDTDAVAFARLVLHTESYVAPLPTDRRRERLYQRIRDGFAAHREYRALRLAAAGAFVAAAPAIDPTYEPLLRRCHWLWLQCDHDPARLAARLQQAGDRSALLREVDAALAADSTAVDAHRRDLADLADWLRRLAAAELARATG